MTRISSMSCQELTTLLPVVSQGKALSNLTPQLFVTLGLKDAPVYGSTTLKNAHKIVASQENPRDLLLVALPLLAMVSVYFGVKTKHALVTFTAGSLAVSITGQKESVISVEARLSKEKILQQLSTGTCPALTTGKDPGSNWLFEKDSPGGDLFLLTNPNSAQFIQEAIKFNWRSMIEFSHPISSVIPNPNPNKIKIGTINTENYTQYAELLKNAIDLAKVDAFAHTHDTKDYIPGSMEDYVALRFRHTELLANYGETPTFTENERNSKYFWSFYAGMQPIDSAAQIDCSSMSQKVQEDLTLRKRLFDLRLDCNWLVSRKPGEVLSNRDVNLLLSKSDDIRTRPDNTGAQAKMLNLMTPQQLATAIGDDKLEISAWPDRLLKTIEQWNILKNAYQGTKFSLRNFLSTKYRVSSHTFGSPGLVQWKEGTPDWVPAEYRELG